MIPIAAPVRKNLKAKGLAESRPELSPREIGKIVGLDASAVLAATKKVRFGRDNPKTYARG